MPLMVLVVLVSTKWNGRCFIATKECGKSKFCCGEMSSCRYFIPRNHHGARLPSSLSVDFFQVSPTNSASASAKISPAAQNWNYFRFRLLSPPNLTLINYSIQLSNFARTKLADVVNFKNWLKKFAEKVWKYLEKSLLQSESLTTRNIWRREIFEITCEKSLTKSKFAHSLSRLFISSRIDFVQESFDLQSFFSGGINFDG